MRIARLFIEGKSNPLLASQIADFYLSQLYLPPNWQEIIRDKNVIGNIVRKKLSGEYTDRKGDYVEGLLRARLQALEDEYGVTFTKGQITLLGKEVDHVIPSFDDPYVLIMSSYMETTSSGQTARANEQQAMYAKLQEQHTRYGKEIAFVNVVDGAGWLARRSDLKKLYRGCDFCLNINTLTGLDAVVFKYVPEQYFTKKEKAKCRNGLTTFAGEFQLVETKSRGRQKDRLGKPSFARVATRSKQSNQRARMSWP